LFFVAIFKYSEFQKRKNLTWKNKVNNVVAKKFRTRDNEDILVNPPTTKHTRRIIQHLQTFLNNLSFHFYKLSLIL